MKEYKYTNCEVSISNYEDENTRFFATLAYSRNTDIITIKISGQDIGMHITMDQFKKQLSQWFEQIAQTID